MPDINCLYCPQQLHFMCMPEENDCCCHLIDSDSNAEANVDVPVEISNKPGNELNLEDKRPVGRPMKTEGFKNLLSTGRKRAAAIYAIQPGQICAWAWKKNCGGGIMPIIGCSGRPAKHIHHGPDKSVLNNKPDNVSVVCTFCHNKWHGMNDKYYPGERPEDGSEWLPDPEYGTIHTLSDATDADPMEIISFEVEMRRPIDKEVVSSKLNTEDNDSINEA